MAVGLVMLLLAGPASATVGHDDGHSRHRYNADYLFAVTRSLPDITAPPALIVPLVPLALVADAACFPFALVLGFVG